MEPTLNWKRGGCVQELDRQLLFFNQHKSKIRGGGTHEHIKSSKLLNGALDGSLDLSLLAHIALDRPGLRLRELGSDDLGSLLDSSPVRSAETPPQSARAREAPDLQREDEKTDRLISARTTVAPSEAKTNDVSSPIPDPAPYHHKQSRSVLAPPSWQVSQRERTNGDDCDL